MGFLIFDGCVETDRTISLGIMCRELRDEIAEIIKKNDLKIKLTKKKDCFHLKTGILSKRELIQWKKFFEPKTEKWYKLNDMIYGFTYRVDSFNQAINVLSNTYTGTSTNKTNLKQMIQFRHPHQLDLSYIFHKELQHLL